MPGSCADHRNWKGGKIRTPSRLKFVSPIRDDGPVAPTYAVSHHLLEMPTTPGVLRVRPPGSPAWSRAAGIIRILR